MRLQVLSEQQVEDIHSASVRILSEVGVCFGSRKALDILSSAGARVDDNWKSVRIPEGLIERALQTTSGHYRLWDRGRNEFIDLQDGQVRGHNVGGCVRIFDAERDLLREATQDDLEQLAKLMDGLENIHVCRPVVYPAECPSSVRDIYTTAIMLQHTGKPYGVTSYSLKNLAYILDLLNVIAGGLAELQAKPFVWGSVCPDSPLFYTENTADILIKYAELGLPVAIAPCPICGGTSPVTLAGSLAQLNAEFLAGLVLVQIVRPGIDVKYTARPMPMDMRTGTATFGAIETGLMSAAIVQLARRYRVCSDVYGLGTRSKALDEQTAYEKALNGLMVGLAGTDLIAAAGLLEDALTSSAEQLVIDNEILGMIFRALQGITVTADTLAFEVISAIGPGGSFLTEPHTLAYMRKEYFQPRLVRSGLVAQFPGDQTLLDVARDRIKAIMQVDRPALLDAAARAEIQRILTVCLET